MSIQKNHPAFGRESRKLLHSRRARPQRNTPQAILFDLDGTLLDTAKGIHHSMHQLLTELSLPTIEEKKVRDLVSLGSRTTLCEALKIPDLDHPLIDALHPTFLKRYADNMTLHTQFFDGIIDVLTVIKERNLKWGIVTNRLESLTFRLLEAFDFPLAPEVVVCMDTINKPKPLPDSILHACNILKVTPSECIFVGDSINDIHAAKAANMPSLAALYGYIQPHEVPTGWGATALINHPRDILKWIDHA